MKKIYICSPYRGDVKKNIENVKQYCSMVSTYGSIPIAPHLFFTQFLDDNNIIDRNQGLRMGQQLLKECDEMYVFADEVSEGMIDEIKVAHECNIPITFHDAEMKEVNHEKLIINNRIGSGLRKIIEDDWAARNGFKECSFGGTCIRRSESAGRRNGET